MVQHPHPYTTLPLETFDFNATTTYHVYLRITKLQKMFPEVTKSFEGKICIQFIHKLGSNRVKLVYPQHRHLPEYFTPRYFMLRVI